MLYTFRKPNLLEISGVRRKFSRGPKFRHNRLTSQINFRGRSPGACPQENVVKLHLKIRIFVHPGSKFSIMLLRDLLAGEKKTELSLSEAYEINLYACLDVISLGMYRLSKALIEVCGLKSHASRSFFLVFIVTCVELLDSHV